MYAMTCYWLVDFHDKSTWHRVTKVDPKITSIEVNGDRLLLPTGFMKAVRLEGSGLYMGVVLNFTGKKWVFQNPNKYPFGRTASGRAVVPWYTIAVDRKALKFRAWYRIPELEGFKLPGGEVHNGIVRALDTGGAIRGRHIDLHVGFKRSWVETRKRLPRRVRLIEQT